MASQQMWQMKWRQGRKTARGSPASKGGRQPQSTQKGEARGRGEEWEMEWKAGGGGARERGAAGGKGEASLGMRDEKRGQVARAAAAEGEGAAGGTAANGKGDSASRPCATQPPS